MATRKSTLKNIASGCVVRSEHGIDMRDAKSIEKEHLKVVISIHLKVFTGPLIKKTVSF